MADYASSLMAPLGTVGSSDPGDQLVNTTSGGGAPQAKDYSSLMNPDYVAPAASSQPQAPQLDRNQLTYAVAAARKGPGAGRDLEKDLTSLEDADLNKIYGDGFSNLRDQLYGEIQTQKDSTLSERSRAQLIGDSINKGAQGAIGFIGGGLALAAGGGNAIGHKINDAVGIEDNNTTRFADKVAPAISEATNSAIGWLNGFTSDVSQEQNRLVAINTQAAADLNAAERDAAVAAGANPTMENFKLFGKNVLDAGAEILDNPTSTMDTITNALGSLGPSAKAVSSVEKLITSTGTYKAAQLAAAIDNTGMGKVLQWAAAGSKTGATAGAVGLTEAAGTYQQTMQEVLDTPEGDLMRNSAEFRDLVKSGVSVADAKIQVAQNTAKQAFWTQLPMATATSILSLKFDANPLQALGEAGMVHGLAGIGKEVLGQGLEEMLQSSSGQYSQNQAVIANVNPNLDIVSGVGEAGAQGLIGGIGMAGVLAVPSAVKAVGDKANDIFNSPPEGPNPFGPNDPNAPSTLDPNLVSALKDRAQADIAKMEGMIGPRTPHQENVRRILRANQDNADVLANLYMPVELSPAAQKAREDAAKDVTPNETLQNVKEAVASGSATAKNIFDKVKTTAQDAFTQAKEAIVQKAKDINTRQTAEEKAATVSAAQSTAIAVYDWVNATGNDAPAGLKDITQPRAADVPPEFSSTLNEAPDVISTVSSLVRDLTNGAIKVKDLGADALLYANEHFDRLRSAMPSMPEDVRKQVQTILNSPVVGQVKARVSGLNMGKLKNASASVMKRMSRINPADVIPDIIDAILSQKDRTDLTDEDIRLMRGASQIAQAVNNHVGNQVQIGKGDVVDFSKPKNDAILNDQNARVSRSIQVDGFGDLPSINDFASGIFRAGQSADPTNAVGPNGDVYSGKALAQRFSNFVQHMINKVEALNQSHDAGGSNVQFEGLNSKGQMIPAGQAGGPKSVAHHPGNQNSIKNAQSIYNDAKAAVEVYRVLQELFPGLMTDGEKTLPDLKVTSPNQDTQVEAKPAQTEAKPTAEAQAKAETGGTNQENTGSERQPVQRQSNDYLVHAEDGDFTVKILRTEDGAAVIFDNREGGQNIKIAPDFLVGKSDEDLMKYYFEPDGFISAQKVLVDRAATKKERAKLKELLDKAYPGHDMPVPKIQVKSVIEKDGNNTDPNGVRGRMHHDGTMELREDVFTNSDALGRATKTLFHEVGHLIDGWGDYNVSSARLWDAVVTELENWLKTEASDAQKQSFAYVMSFKGKDEERFKAETFAELFAHMGLRPEFVHKNFPTAEKLMKQALVDALGEPKNTRPEDPKNVVLPILSENRAAHVAKDQVKADKSNKFIGRGSDKSSTEAYRLAWGDRANTGSYTSSDVVMLSVEGARTGRIDPDFAEIKKAMDAGATLITDIPADRNTRYNVGERQVAKYLEENGYVESAPGTWTQSKTEAKPSENTNEQTPSQDGAAASSTPVEDVKAPTIDVPDDTVTDSETGLPVIFFHGTTAKFDQFNDGETFFTNQYHLAAQHATRDKTKKGARVIGVNLVMANPLMVDAGSNDPDTYYMQNTIKIKADYAKDDHDGILVFNDTGFAVGIVYSNSQIVSAEYHPKTKKQVFKTTEVVRNDLFNSVLTPSKTPSQFNSLNDLLNQVDDFGEHLTEFTAFMEKNVPAVLKVLNARLVSVKFSAKGTESVLDMYRKDPARVLSIRDYKNLAFVDPTTGQYDPLIATLAVSLVIDALTNAHPAAPSLLLDRMDEDGLTFDQMTEEQLADYMDSISIRDLAERMARQLPGLIGYDIQDSATLKDARGVLEDLIKEIITATSQMGDQSLVRIAPSPGKGITDSVILTAKTRNAQKAMGLNGRAGLSQMLFPENQSGPTLGAAPTFVAQTQTKGKMETSVSEKQVLTNMQSIGHRRTPVAGLIKALGPEVMFTLLGGKPVTHLAQNHPLRRSIEGKNLSIERDYEDAVFITEAMLEQNALAYYPVGISRVGRHGMQGPNPQNNKILRHSATPTWSTLDMRDNQTHRDYFWLTVAQSAGFAKAEKANHEKVFQETEAQFRSLYRDAIFLAREYLISGEIDAAQFATAIRGINGVPEGSIVPEGTTVVGQDVTMAIIDAVMAVAALDEAKASGSEDAFETSLSFEIDGLTDGPGNMAMNMGQGILTVNDYENLRRIGFFPGERNMTTNKYYNNEENKDFYEMTTQYAEAASLGSHRDRVRMQALARFAAYFGDFKVVKGPDGQLSYKMTRNTAKSPVTKKGYGSGVSGIARGISEDMLLEFYRHMVEDHVHGPEQDLGYTQFREDFRILFGSEFNEETPWERSFFDKRTTEGFQLLVSDTLGKILTEAAEKMLGAEIKKVNDTLVFVTNIQAEYLRLAFEQRVQAVLEARLGKSNTGEQRRIQDLTVGELKKIISDLGALAPVYFNGTQSLGLGSFENQVHDKAEFSSNMDGRLRMKSTLPIPSEAGVKVIPYLNIGRGDAMMMNVVYGNENFPSRSIPIYDGVSLAIADIAEISDLINNAVAENWKQDLLGPVIHDLTRFSQSVPDNEQNLLQLAFDVVKAKSKNIKYESLEQTAAALIRMQQFNLARKAVFERIPRSVNHMAGANRPVNFGPEGYVDMGEINDLIRAELLSPTETPKETQDQKNEFSTLSVMKGSEMIRALLETVKNKRLIEVLNTLRAANPNVRVITGNHAQIAAHRLNEGADSVLTTRTGSGFYDPANQTIYLVSKKHETLVHELIHFATFSLVHEVYQGRGTEQQRGAVARLEDLMHQFMGMDFSDAPKAAQRAAKSAKAQILEHQAKKDAWSKASALNEFMAWSLSSEPLMKEMGNTLVEGAVALVKRVKALLARLLGSVAYDMFSHVLFNTRAILEPELNQEPEAVDPKTNEPPTASEKEEALTDEIMEDPEVEGDIFGHGGMLVPVGSEDIFTPEGSGAVPPLMLPPPGGGNGNGNGSNGSNDPGGTGKYNNFWINLLRTKLNAIHPKNQAQGRTAKTDQAVRYLRNAERSYNAMVSGGFQFTEEQKLTYQAIHMILALEVKLDARALAAMNKVFAFTVENLRADMFTGEAQDKYQAFLDALGNTRNDEGITDAIATFFAMSQTNNEFRFVLEHMPRPTEKGASSFAEFVSTMAMSMMRKAVGSIDPNDQNARQSMDMLARVILAQDTQQEFKILRTLMSSFDMADKYLSGKLRQFAGFMEETNQQMPDKTGMKAAVIQGITLAAGLLSDDHADITYDFIKDMTHNGSGLDQFVFLRELVAEMIGTDKNNEQVVALLDLVKKQVAALRQSYRENVPLTLQGQFDNKPSAAQWKTAHTVLARTDFSTLFDLNQADTTMSLISDTAYRERQIKIYTDTIKNQLGKTQALNVIDKAQQLADFMNGKGAGFMLLRNAYAINQILGNPKVPDLAKAIDKLVSLLALDGQDPADLQTIADMYSADPEGMKGVMVYMQKLNQNEELKLKESSLVFNENDEEVDHDPIERMKMNGYKGYVPNLGNPDVTITVEDDQHRKILEQRGFVRVGDYTADSMVTTQSRGYYVSTTRQNGGYAQGVMQSIQNTYRGVNAGTGITTNGTTSGLIMGKKNLDRIDDFYYKSGTVADSKETLIPVYDGRDVVYYERAINPDITEKFSAPDGNLALMLGVWAGRQVEEKAAQSYNALLVDQLKKVWDNRLGNEDGLFIDLRAEYQSWLLWQNANDEQRKTMRRPDPIYADSWKVIPPQTKAYIAGVFGADGFMVRKDQINTALGYAEPSFADFWTGKTRFSEGTQQVVQAITNMTLGRLKNGTSGLSLLQTGAGAVQETVSLAKDLIVTRSLIVPYLNSQANIFALTMRGVPNRQILTGYRDKLIEIEAYNQNFKKIMFLQTQLELSENDANRQMIIRREIQVIKDQNQRMSIHPLVEAGAYKNISEGITDEDFEILKHGLSAVVEQQVDRLPDIAKTIVKNGLVSQTTNIYKVANKSVQYGDFLAKAVYYDFLLANGMTHDEALVRINEEYVNFSTPPGRVRSALDKFGATWFLAYKLRITKTALAQARQNPLRALLVNTLDPGHNTAAHSNVVAMAANGSLGYSMGMGMLFNSPGLNPWLNLMGW